MIIDGYSAEDINNNAMKSMNQYILKRNSELIERKVIEDIRAEIEEQKNGRCFDDDDMDIYNTGLNDAIDIIDKHIGGRK